MLKNNKENKCVLVTGAYGGMGYATIKNLAKNGFTVFALDKNIGSTEENVIPIQTDVTDIESVKKSFEIVSKKTKKLFAIIHFAGVYMLDSLVEMSEERFKKIFDINLFGVYRINKTFLPLLENNSRIIITTSELAVTNPLPFTGIYAISKTALDKYAFSLRMELQLLNINVCVIRPGAVKTNLLSVSTKELDDFCNNTKLYDYNAEKFKRIVNSVEVKNIMPDKVAKKVEKILKSKKPKYVYNINRNPLLKMLNILPAKWQTKIIKNVLTKK